MSGSRKGEILAIVALLLGAIGVTLGYAAFSNSLNVSYSAVVTPDAALFNVDFSTKNDGLMTGPVTPKYNRAAKNFTATTGQIDNTGDPTVSNLHVRFTEPDEEVTYTFYAYNAGRYAAYLNSLIFSGTKECTPATGTDPTMVAAACNGISFSVKVGDEAASNTSIASIEHHELGINNSDMVVVTITYADGSAIADGDFDVTLPSVVLTYDSVD